jgi:hypothetical protein
MDFTRATLTALLDDDSRCCISLFMPMTVTGRERAGNRVRFRNLIRDTEELLEHSSDDVDAKELLRPLRELYENEQAQVWQHPRPGLILFRSLERCEVYAVRNEQNEEVHVGSRYYLRPLLRLLQGDGGFFLLAASQNVVRLFEGSRETIIERHPESLPSNLVEALNVDEWTSTLQYHSQSRGPRKEAIFHGQGAGEDDRKQELLQFFQRLNDALTQYLAKRSEPLVFAGVEHLFPIFEEACTYRPLIEAPLAGNPDQLTADELHEGAWKLVAPYFRVELESAITRFGNAIATDLGTADLQAIVAAAQTGGVDTLLIKGRESIWGELDDSGNIRIHDSHQEESVDLVDEAAFLTLKTGGQVWVVDRDGFPVNVDAAAAAVLRYPSPVDVKRR